MSKNTVTTQTINRLIEAPIVVKMWNGCFNIAVATAEFARHRFELSVEVTHPLLQRQCGNKKDVTLVRWQACNGYMVDLPEELKAKVALMVAAATMTDEAAAKVLAENQASFAASMEAMGW